MNWELAKDILTVGVGLVGVFAFGTLTTMKNTITAQKDYISALEKKREELNGENTDLKDKYQETMLHVKQLEGRLDSIRDIPLESIARNLQTILDNQQKFITSHNIPTGGTP